MSKKKKLAAVILVFCLVFIIGYAALYLYSPIRYGKKISIKTVDRSELCDVKNCGSTCSYCDGMLIFNKCIGDLESNIYTECSEWIFN